MPILALGLVVLPVAAFEWPVALPRDFSLRLCGDLAVDNIFRCVHTPNSCNTSSALSDCFGPVLVLDVRLAAVGAHGITRALAQRHNDLIGDHTLV